MPKIAKKNYDWWTREMLSEVYREDRIIWYVNQPVPFTTEQNKKANDLILNTLYNEEFCKDHLSKMSKEEYLKYRDKMIREVHDSYCFTESFILSFFKWNKFFGVLEGVG
ncbi:MAG: hypothetical protein KGI25_03745 [Thaumarchaeota archaeon]|nr:hypothetical protein [Nitrososphaerota archaeon]